MQNATFWAWHSHCNRKPRETVVTCTGPVQAWPGQQSVTCGGGALGGSAPHRWTTGYWQILGERSHCFQCAPACESTIFRCILSSPGHTNDPGETQKVTNESKKKSWMWERGLEGEGTDVGEWEMVDSREKAGRMCSVHEWNQKTNALQGKEAVIYEETQELRWLQAVSNQRPDKHQILSDLQVPDNVHQRKGDRCGH